MNALMLRNHVAAIGRVISRSLCNRDIHCWPRVILCALLLAGCGNEAAAPLVVSTPISADLLMPCDRWQGATPQTEGPLIDAASAERAGRLRCNAKVIAIGETVGK